MEQRGLAERERAILDFEAQWPRHSATKEEAIRESFSIPAARYYQILNAIIDSPAAVRHDPMLVSRLQRARDARAKARAARAFTPLSSAEARGHDLPTESNDHDGEAS
jgi:hypothetical protein